MKNGDFPMLNYQRVIKHGNEQFPIWMEKPNGGPRLRWQLRSNGAHWDRELADEVQQCPQLSVGEEEEENEKEEKESFV